MSRLVSLVAVEFALRARAQAILAARAPERVQAHSRQLPTETEIASGQFAARQFIAAADDLSAGLLLDAVETEQSEASATARPQREQLACSPSEDGSADAETKGKQ